MTASIPLQDGEDYITGTGLLQQGFRTPGRLGFRPRREKGGPRRKRNTFTYNSERFLPPLTSHSGRNAVFSRGPDFAARRDSLTFSGEPGITGMLEEGGPGGSAPKAQNPRGARENEVNG